MADWMTIDTAPKTGIPIQLTWMEDGEPQDRFIMRWDPDFTNGLFPGVVGMWVTIDGAFTWNDHPEHGGGPTHWRHYLQ